MGKGRPGCIRRIGLGVVLAGFVLAIIASTSSARTVWLCQPGQRNDPCAPGLSTTVYSPSLNPVGVQHAKPVRHPAIDCFYVYPTVSDQPSGNASLHVYPEERSIALYQAGRFSQYCQVYAPIYREVTFAAVGPAGHAAKPNQALPFEDVKSALKTYLTRYNHGRGFVLIGSGQGAFVLRALVHAYLDPHPLLRRLLVSAILLGGDVLVKQGTGIGGDFQHIPACRSATQLGCVIAFSTFDQPVPALSLFGRAGSVERRHHEAVLCTNPAGLGGGSGLLKPIFPSQPFNPTNLVSRLIASYRLGLPIAATTWIAEQGGYRARCSTANRASVLNVTPLHGAPTPVPSPAPAWGLHFLDVNLTLGNLLSIVKHEATAFVHTRG